MGRVGDVPLPVIAFWFGSRWLIFQQLPAGKKMLKTLKKLKHFTLFVAAAVASKDAVSSI